MRKTSRHRALRVAGVMTGTSCDALDVSVLEFKSGTSITRPAWQVLGNASQEFDADLRREVHSLQEPGTQVSLLELLRLERRLGSWFGATLRSMFAEKRLPEADLIALHGQTVAHHPAHPPRVQEGLTLQIGSPEAVAMATGLTVVSHFRDGDILAGGQGAPLVPAFQREWVRKHLPARAITRGVALHNIGGMSNLTYLGPGKRIIAFDTGPGNAWIDDATRIHTSGRYQFDRGGRIAAAHPVQRDIVEKLLRRKYFKLAPPKSTGRDEFPFELLLRSFGKNTRAQSGELVSTATEVTAVSIIHSYERFILGAGLPLSQIILCGGGAFNPELSARIRTGMLKHGVKVHSIQDILGSKNESSATYLEAQAFAFFGFQAIHGVPIGGEWTGSRIFAPPGRITPGKNFPVLFSGLSASK